MLTNKGDGVTVVLGVIGAGCHVIGNKILEHSFREADSA